MQLCTMQGADNWRAFLLPHTHSAPAPEFSTSAGWMMQMVRVLPTHLKCLSSDV